MKYKQLLQTPPVSFPYITDWVSIFAICEAKAW
jgi:hypothetical protein